MLIFSGPKAYEDHRHQKLTHRHIYTTAPVVLIYLRVGLSGQLPSIEMTTLITSWR